MKVFSARRLKDAAIFLLVTGLLLVAADGVRSGRVDGIDPNEGPLIYTFLRDHVPELLPLPPFPSTRGHRKRQVAGDTIFPVDVFGELYLMAHPNADGQEPIVRSVLEVLPNPQPFARWSALRDTRTAERRRMGDS
jgi:hypothetical protein